MTNFFTYDIETQKTGRARPYVFCFYGLGKLASRYDRNLTPDEIQKSKNDTIAFGGDKCGLKALDFCLKLKGENEN